MLLEEAKRVGALVLLEPGAMAELDERHERVEQVSCGGDLGQCLARLLDPRVVLEQHAAELARALEWRKRLAEVAERRLALPLAVPGHLAARLHVEHEVIRRSLRPLRRHLGRGQSVERRVSLDDVVVLRVVAEPLRCAPHRGRVPVLRHPLVRPRADADADGGHFLNVTRTIGLATAKAPTVELTHVGNSPTGKVAQSPGWSTAGVANRTW